MRPFQGPAVPGAVFPKETFPEGRRLCTLFHGGVPWSFSSPCRKWPRPNCARD